MTPEHLPNPPEPPAGRPSLRLIAAKSGLSIAAVSMALSNKPGIPVSTRQKVERIAREIGYEKNPAVSAILSGVRNVGASGIHSAIAFLTTWPAHLSWRDSPILREQYERARSAAGQSGFALDEICVSQVERKRTMEILDARGISGVLLQAPFSYLTHYRLDWSRLIACKLGWDFGAPHTNSTRKSFFQGTYLAWHRLQSLGFRRIGLALRYHQHFASQGEIVACFNLCQNALPAADRVPLYLQPKDTDSWTRNDFVAWLRQHRPEVVLHLGDETRGWVESAGFHVPDQISLVHLDLPPGDSSAAGINLRDGDLGAVATSLLVQQLIASHQHGVSSTHLKVTLDPLWVPGPTLAARTRTRKKRPVPKGRRITKPPLS